MDIAKVQKILATKAFHQPNHRFNDLYRYLKDERWLQSARFAILQNDGAKTPGVDGVVGKDLTEAEWQDIIQQTITDFERGEYQPLPVERIYIPKANGIDMRPLGIPTIRDRMVQEVIRMVLEPIYESHFLPCSFGFRPNKSTMDAVHGVQLHMNNKIKQFWVVEGDIKGCFDNIPHKQLIQVLRKRIADERLLTVIWSFLKAGYMEDDQCFTPSCGTPQGGICSPLLANIYLHEMDTYWFTHYGNLTAWQKKQRRRKGMGNVTLIRYADDFLILTNGPKTEALALKEEFSQVLSELGLVLSPGKTLITHANDGLDFLGFHIHRRPQRLHPERKVVYITPTQRNVERYKDKIRSMLKGTQGDVVNKIRALNRVIRGWANYYRHVQSSHRRKTLEYWTYWALWRWLRRKHDLGAKALYAQFTTQPPSGKRCLGYKGVYLVDMTRIRFEKYIAHPSLSPYLLENSSLMIRDEQPIALETCDGMSSQTGYAIHRQDLLAIYGKYCQKCGKHELPGRLHTHHIVARKDGGKDNLTNLILLCQDCHKETASYGRKRREI